MEEQECRTCRWWQLIDLGATLDECRGLCCAPVPLPISLKGHDLDMTTQAGTQTCACWACRDD